ncbi:RTA1 like protein-domain-containing protein [Aspergillus navahoensis]
MRPHLSLLLLLVSAIAVLAIPAPTPAPTASAKSIETRDFEVSLDLPTISIKSFTLSSIDLNLPSNTCTPPVIPDANGYVLPDQCNALFEYYPSFAAAVAFSILFGALTTAHFVQATVYKSGFVWHQQDTTILTITQLFILLSPILVNAFDYMVLARMINFFVPERQIGIFKPSLLAFVFVILDISSFVIQLIGGGMATPSADAATMQKGIHIYMGGIGIQQFFIILFLIIAIQFHRRMLQLSQEGRLVGLKAQWKRLLYALYISLLFITIRIIYRLVEFSKGNDDSNPITHNEWYMYAFDAGPMWCAIAVWNVIHPGAVIKGPDAVMPPSPMRKIFCCACCCSCCKRRKQKEMQKISDEDPSGGDEMLPLNV